MPSSGFWIEGSFLCCWAVSCCCGGVGFGDGGGRVVVLFWYGFGGDAGN